MIRTVAAAVAEVQKLNEAGLGARPDYGEFIQACVEAVRQGHLVELRPAPGARREFWVPALQPDTSQRS